ncbi:head GIN domain-containing protein [Parafilimonas sp.]|uniref:head GIN domain-containing protein n=1 Tax=Parafilimonas sp. TaxID=1969739 RepID=UPI0039E43D73
MKKLFILFSFLSYAAILNAQSTVIRDANAEARKASGFHAIEVSTGIDLIITQGKEEAVAVSAASPEIRSHIITEVSNGKLKIYFDNKGMNGWHVKKELKAYVSFTTLDALEANSGADVLTDGNINVNTLSIRLSSGADFKGDVTAAKLVVDQSSGSDMDIKGKVNDVSITTNGGSDFNGYDLVSETCKADASSGSDIEITVSKTLDASASSGGGIKYKGSASVTNISNSSGGKVKKQG